MITNETVAFKVQKLALTGTSPVSSHVRSIPLNLNLKDQSCTFEHSSEVFVFLESDNISDSKIARELDYSFQVFLLGWYIQGYIP